MVASAISGSYSVVLSIGNTHVIKLVSFSPINLVLQEVLSQEPEGQRGNYFSFPTAQSHQTGPTQMAKPQIPPLLYFCLGNYKSRLSPTCSSGLIICQDGSQGSGKPFHLLDDQFIIKQYSSGTTRWKRRTGQGV